MRRLILSAACMVLVAMLVGAQRIAVLSDVHVTPGNAFDQALRDAVAEINACEYDLVVMNGDLTNEGSDEQLLRVKTILDQIRHPLCVLPGNHEDTWSQSATMAFPRLWGADRFVTVVDSLVVIGVNCGPYMKMGDGHVKQEDLHWLAHALDSLCTGGRRVLSFNHYPIRKDDMDNYADYASTLAAYPVIAHINGHYHKWMRYETAGLECVMTRALGMGDGNYGYTIVEVSPDWVQVYDKQIGCEPVPMYGIPARVAIDKDQAVALAKSDMPAMPAGWDVRLAYADSSSIFTRLTFDKDNVYFGNSLGSVKAVDKQSGALSWSRNMGSPLYSRPVVLPNQNLVVAVGGKAYMLKATNGKLVKTLCDDSAGPYVADGIVTDDGKCYVQGGYKKIECYDAKTGRRRYAYADIDNYCQAAPAVKGDLLVFGAWDTYLRCLDLNRGTLKWKWSNGKQANMLGPGNVVPYIGDDKVIVVAPDRYMTAIDLETGETLWRNNKYRYRESMGHSQDGKAVYAKTMDGQLVAVDATTPEFAELWVVDMGIGYDHAPCVVAESNGLVYAGSRRGIVTVVDPKTREVVMQVQLGNSEINGIDIDPDDGSAWVSLIEGKVYRIAPQNSVD